MTKCLPLVLSFLLMGCADAVSQDWPQFRGPAGLGVAEVRGLPTRWSDSEHLLWKTELPGAGTSSPILIGDRVYVTCHTGFGTSQREPGRMDALKRFLICLSRRDGKLLWKREVPTRLPEAEYGRRMFWHGYASSTPVADAERVYAFFGSSGVFAFDHDGSLLWQANVGEGTHGWGSGSSPILHKNLVILNAFVESGRLVALDKSTGKEVWSAGGLKESWNTPLLVELPDGGTELVVGIFGKILGFDPDNGDQLWTCQGIDWYIVGSLVAHHGVVYCVAGSDYEAIAIQAGGRGDTSDSHVLWRANKGSNVSSAVYYDEHLYFAHESQGIAYCLNAKTGEVVYDVRIPQRGGEIYASPVIADGKLFYVRRQGGTLVLPSKPKFEVLAHNVFESDDSIFNASPAVEKGRIYLRSNKYLYCLGDASRSNE